MVDPSEQAPGTVRIWNADTLRLVRDIDAVLESRPTDRQALVALRLAIAEMLGACDALTLQALHAEPALPPSPPPAEGVRRPARKRR